MMYAVSFVLLSFITCIGSKGRVQKSSKNNSNLNIFDHYNFKPKYYCKVGGVIGQNYQFRGKLSNVSQHFASDIEQLTWHI